MDVILWRHAEAEEGFPDGERRLTPKGCRQAAKVGRWLAGRLEGRYRLLSSPAARAVETAEALRGRMEVLPELNSAADPAALLAAAGWPEGEGAVVLVGHQPMLGEVAAYLLTGRPEPWSVKKGAAWWFRTTDSGGRRETTLRAVVGPDLA